MSAKKSASPTAPPRLPPATISEDDGVRLLHLGTEWIQGAMRLKKPDAIELEYVQQMMMWMLFNDAPRHIVQLGLGSAALTKFCYRQFPDARITAIELNAAVIDICHAKFALPPNDARLQVLEQDALAFVTDAANRGSVDILQVDLYDAEARGPVFAGEDFYQACANCLAPDGMATINLFGDHDGYGLNLAAMQPAFDALTCLSSRTEEANIVVIGFKHAPVVDFSVLAQRAAAIRRQTGLPARSWVLGMQNWMREEGDCAGLAASPGQFAAGIDRVQGRQADQAVDDAR